MALPLYLAQTSIEMAGNPLPENPAYMACHFSPGGQGLSNLPRKLHPGTLLILDDSIPLDGHDPELISSQLSDLVQQFDCTALLLDFQRRDIPGQGMLARSLCEALPCPVAVSEAYAQGLSCPVFLPPVPPDMPVSDYLHPWQDREVWLEAALDGIILTLTEAGCTVEPLFGFPAEGMQDEKLHCRYSIGATATSATFQLWRTGADLNALLKEAAALGVTGAVGLWQELGR